MTFHPGGTSVDCKVGNWKQGSCNARCGEKGWATQTREVTRQQEGTGKACPRLERNVGCWGEACPGYQKQNTKFIIYFPVHCEVSVWILEPSTCNARCGSQGFGTFTRQVTRNQVGSGRACPSLIKTAQCRGEVCSGK